MPQRRDGTQLLPTGGPGYPGGGTGWQGTAHATALQRKIEGSVGQAFGESCLECHTVGYDKSATTNNGFNDVEKAAGWTYPAKNQPGNWSALESIQSPNNLADLAGIQCENCHGPQGNVSNVDPRHGRHGLRGPHLVVRGGLRELPRGLRSSTTSPRSGWSRARTARTPTARWRSRKAAAPQQLCGRCHSAQGYARYAKNLPSGYYGYLTSDGNPLDPTYPAATAKNTPATAAAAQRPQMNKAQVEPQTCQACHDPHDNTASGTARAGS